MQLPTVVAFLLTILLSTVAWGQSSSSTDDTPAMQLPSLANTAAMDRLLLREIGDTHIFDASSLSEPATQGCCQQGGASSSDATPGRAPAGTVWQFVQQSRRLPIPDNEAIANYRQQYQREALWISKILHRATPFAGHIVELLDARYMPVELALLPAIESGYQPSVHSAEHAVGIWQIVPATAREMGVIHNSWYDGRSDLVESTNAALEYLSYLNAEFHGDWLLTLAAYNAGPGRVRSAIRRNRARGLSQDFWSLPLPRETREYVPKFLALVAMMRHDSPPDLDIPLIPRGNAFEVLEFAHRTSLDKVAAVSAISETTLKGLNAALVHGVTPPDGPHHVYVLKSESARVVEAVSNRTPSELYTLPATHTVVAGDSISAIAATYGLQQSDLMAINELEGSMIRVGQKLAVRFSGDDTDSSIEYVVTIGDTLSDIAQQFSVGLDHIRDEHGQSLQGDVIHPGEKLSIVQSRDKTG
ncbi:transglycosylase SLT domain-containing protein [Granulosicoccus sp. 3-233]|uniref:transglycosylase SLT domain-containing protein n=1 Tax=Granulosicoccus sp. 3-233 TaxID=3417969 RepID=UPI003D338916